MNAKVKMLNPEPAAAKHHTIRKNESKAFLSCSEALSSDIEIIKNADWFSGLVMILVLIRPDNPYSILIESPLTISFHLDVYILHQGRKRLATENTSINNAKLVRINHFLGIIGNNLLWIAS